MQSDHAYELIKCVKQCVCVSGEKRFYFIFGQNLVRWRANCVHASHFRIIVLRCFQQNIDQCPLKVFGGPEAKFV